MQKVRTRKGTNVFINMQNQYKSFQTLDYTLIGIF